MGAGMDDTQFDAWTRRRFGLTTGGTLASLFGLLRLDEADAKNKKKKRRRRRKKKQRRREKRRDNNNGGNPGPPADHPDILLIYVDDMREDDYAALSRTRSLIADQGATYPNYFITTPLCAPSRASLFRGQYAHNTDVRSNNGPNGGFTAFDRINEDTIAVWLRGADPVYRTAHVGKHINGYNAANNQIGPGWSDWIVPVPVTFYDYKLNVNGKSEKHKSKRKDYLTDVLARKARNIIASTPASTPLFLYFAPKAPHGPSTPAKRHIGAFADAKLDRPPSFNEADISDKPQYMQRPPLDEQDIDALEQMNQLRLESLLAVDEAVASLINALETAGRLDNAYIMFVTDNGYLLGEHRRTAKNVPYEEAIRMSMLLRGPGVRQGTNDAFVANIDLAPTFAELAGVTPPSYVDGRSLVETFDGSGNGRQAMLLEMFAPGPVPDPEDVEDILPAERRLLAEQAAVPTARRAIRTADWVYVDNESDSPELYDLQNDPFQLRSLHDDPDQSQNIAQLSAWLNTLRDCDAGACRDAENGPPD